MIHRGNIAHLPPLPRHTLSRLSAGAAATSSVSGGATRKRANGRSDRSILSDLMTFAAGPRRERERQFTKNVRLDDWSQGWNFSVSKTLWNGKESLNLTKFVTCNYIKLLNRFSGNSSAEFTSAEEFPENLFHRMA